MFLYLLIKNLKKNLGDFCTEVTMYTHTSISPKSYSSLFKLSIRAGGVYTDPKSLNDYEFSVPKDKTFGVLERP